MKLNFEQIKEITTGAARVLSETGGVKFFRFTKEQEDVYLYNPPFHKKTFSTAGIRLRFKTNSESLFLKVITSLTGKRSYFSFDVFVNNEPVGFIDNFSGVKTPVDYTKEKFALGRFSKTFYLGEGEKEVCIFFPWSVSVLLEDIEVDDGAFIKAVKPEKTLLAFGDSITHGYDALRPSMRYISKLADALGAEEFNKAMGGEIFYPNHAKADNGFEPDYITVAYGTNDWSNTMEDSFKQACREFYKTLSEKYKNSKIFALTPIWRKDYKEYRSFGEFEKVEQDIIEIVQEFDNVTPISGYNFVPHSEEYFADLRLHPNNEGFDYYWKNLYKEIEKTL